VDNKNKHVFRFDHLIIFIDSDPWIHDVMYLDVMKNKRRSRKVVANLNQQG
jgi:hypothetical protein